MSQKYVQISKLWESAFATRVTKCPRNLSCNFRKNMIIFRFNPYPNDILEKVIIKKEYFEFFQYIFSTIFIIKYGEKKL